MLSDQLFQVGFVFVSLGSFLFLIFSVRVFRSSPGFRSYCAVLRRTVPYGKTPCFKCFLKLCRGVCVCFDYVTYYVCLNCLFFFAFPHARHTTHAARSLDMLSALLAKTNQTLARDPTLAGFDLIIMESFEVPYQALWTKALASIRETLQFRQSKHHPVGQAKRNPVGENQTKSCRQKPNETWNMAMIFSQHLHAYCHCHCGFKGKMTASVGEVSASAALAAPRLSSLP